MSLYYNKTPEAGGEGAEARLEANAAPGPASPSAATRVRRHPERAAYDWASIEAILDEGLIGHLGFASEGRPYVMPMLYARNGRHLFLHGSPHSRLLTALAQGVPLCLTVTLLDGLVLARSAFRHSLNYRSVVVLGQGRVVEDPEEKQAALRSLVEHVMSGRSSQVRGPSEAELKVTQVVALDLREASAKARSGPPHDNPGDYALPVWAGVLPLGLTAQPPIADARCRAPEPAGLATYGRGPSRRPSRGHRPCPASPRS